MFDFGAAASGGESGSESMPTMGFLDHLEELRKRLVYSIVAVIAGTGICWGYRERIYGVMQKPIVDALRAHHLPEKLVYINPTDPFNLYLKIAMMAGLFLTSPFVLYQVWMFISPGLYRNEKKYVVPFMVSTIALFSLGGYFGYRIAYPRALEFLHRLQRPVPAHDHDRRIHIAVSEHRARHGTDFRDADPRIFSGVPGHHDAELHDQELPLRHSRSSSFSRRSLRPRLTS